MKPGPKPRAKVAIYWSSDFAYALGLLTADGCISSNGRHIDFTSKDRELVEAFKKCLSLDTKISKKYSGSNNVSYHTQFGDVLFVQFLKSIGLTSAKSKSISRLAIKDMYFSDFLRGYFDGDGTSYSYQDKRFPKSFRFYISFTSASPKYLYWLQEELAKKCGVSGSICSNRNNDYKQLKYAKYDSVAICQSMYYHANVPCLSRKKLKIQKSLVCMRAN